MLATTAEEGQIGASATVPQPVRIEVTGYEKRYSQRPTFTATTDQLYDAYGANAPVVTIRLRIHDVTGERNFYRLKVRGVGESVDDSGVIQKYFLNDVFLSEDAIFIDNSLGKSYGGWPERFSYVFDDRLFDGQAYDFEVESRQRLGRNPRVVVELQSLTSDLYYYMKSVMQYRVADRDIYTEPVQIVSNVGNGYGIVGALSFDRHILYY